MKKYLTLVFLFTAFFAFAAEDFADMIDKAELWIEKNYKGGYAKQYQRDKLKKICVDETKDEAAKIIELKKAFPKVFQKEEKPLIYLSSLSWKIHSLSLGYDIKESATSNVKAVDILKSIRQKEIENNNLFQKSIRTGHKVDAGANAGVELGANPFYWLKNLSNTKIQPHASYSYGRDSANQQSELWSDRNKEIFLKKREQITEMIHQVGVSNLHLTFTVTFTNHSSEPVFFNVKDAYIPIYIGEKAINNSAKAYRTTPNVVINGGQTIDVIFRVELDTTTARELIAFMGTQTPDINIYKGYIPIVSKNGQNMFVSYERVDTTPVHVSAPEFFFTWNIRKHHTSNSEKVTIREALKAINEDLNRVVQKDLLKWDNKTLVSFSDIPFEISSDKKVKYRYFVFLQDNDSKKIIPVNAENLDKPLPVSGVTLWSIDFEKEKSYENIPSLVKRQILEKLEQVVKKKQQPNLMALVGYLYGENFPTKDEKVAFEWIRKSAEHGDSDGQAFLGVYYLIGMGVEANEKVAFEWIRKSAEQDNVYGQFLLGLCYRDGIGVEKDGKAAFEWLQKAAKQDVVDAQVALAVCYRDGIGVKKDENLALKLFHKFAEDGVVEAQVELGKCYYNSIGTSQNIPEAVKWFRAAAEQGDVWGQFGLATCYSEVASIRNYEEAAKWYRAAAEQNHLTAQCYLGMCYLTGIGVPQDYGKAFEWIRKPAELEVPKAQLLLGQFYLNGIGVAKDHDEAFGWIYKSAKQKDSEGQVELGRCYLNGIGVSKDHDKAFEWIRKSAEQGAAIGQFELGKCYLNGIGVKTNEKAAFDLFCKAAKQGYIEAQVELGKCYYNGIGTSQDIPEAVRWFRAAAEQGDVWGQFGLATCYAEVTAVKNYEEAAKWYRKAAEQGHSQARYNLALLYYFGWGVEENYYECIKLARNAADHGFAEAQYLIGMCYYNLKNNAEAKVWLQKAADQGYELAKKALQEIGQ